MGAVRAASKRLALFVKKNRATLFLTLFVVIFFWQYLCLSRTSVFGDTSWYYYPGRIFFRAAFRSGHLPFWCRDIFSGYPLYADSESGLFYLPTLLSFFLPALAGLNYFIFLHYLALALFTYMYGRVIGLSRAASVFAGLSFALAGFALAHIGQVNVVASMTWFPLILYLIEKGLQKDAYSYFLWAGLVLGLQFLAGFLMVSLFTITLAFFYVMLHPQEAGRSMRGMLRVLGMFGVFLVIGFGLGAIQNLPSVELVKESVRAGGLNPSSASQYNFPPLNIISFVFPFFFGTPARYWGPWNIAEVHAYVGILPVMLAPAALFRKASWHAKFFLGAGLTAFILSFGKLGYLYSLLHRLPGYSVLKEPARFVMIVDFALIILAAIGLDRLLARKDFGLRRIARLTRGLLIGTALLFAGLTATRILLGHDILGFGTFAWRLAGALGYHNLHPLVSTVSITNSAFFVPAILILVVLGFLWLWRKGLLNRRIMVAVFLGLVIFELFFVGHELFPMIVAKGIGQEPAVIRSIKEDGGAFRVLSTTREGWSEYRPNALMTYGLEDVNGYSSVAPMRYQFFQRWGIQNVNWTAVNLLNVRYIIDRVSWVNGQPFDLARPLSFSGPGQSQQWYGGGSPAHSVEFLSAISGGVSLPAGTKVAELYAQVNGAELGPYPIRVGIETGQLEYDAQPSRPDGEPAPMPIFKAGGAGEKRFYLGVLALDNQADTDVLGIRLVTTADLGGRTFQVSGINLVGSERDPLQVGPRVARDGEILVYRNPGEMPRAFMVGNVAFVSDFAAATNKLLKGNLDPMKTATLETPCVDPLLQAKMAAWQPDRNVQGTAHFSQKEDGKISIDADAPDECVLIVSQNYMGGWKATIDGEPTPVFPAWGALTALYLPKGSHHIQMVYDPPGLRTGALITLLALVAGILGLVFIGLRERHRRRLS